MLHRQEYDSRPVPLIQLNYPRLEKLKKVPVEKVFLKFHEISPNFNLNILHHKPFLCLETLQYGGQMGDHFYIIELSLQLNPRCVSYLPSYNPNLKSQKCILPPNPPSRRGGGQLTKPSRPKYFHRSPLGSQITIQNLISNLSSQTPSIIQTWVTLGATLP